MFLKEEEKSFYSKDKVEIKCDVCNAFYTTRLDCANLQYKKNNKHSCKSCSIKALANSRKGIKRPPEVTEKAKKTRNETISIKYPSFTISCKTCNKDFKVPYRDRDRQYCGRSCQSKAIIKSDIRSISNCIICKKDFKHYGERIVCSRACNAKYMSVIRIGENNPAYKDKKNKKCLNCNKEFTYDRGGLHINQERVFCSLACAHNIDIKGFSTNPKNGYPFGWNKKLKDSIKSRDNKECQLCGCKDKLHIHHIDYDKTNLEEENLITLCQKCHNMTHHGRTFWEIIFSGMISGSKLVKKDWGGEIHIANNNDYCLKYLIFFKDKQFSFHTHNIKKELWHCVYGKFECVLQKDDVKDGFIFKQGDKIQIEKNVIHQLQAIKNSILVEVSTKDYPEDSIRIINGIN